MHDVRWLEEIEMSPYSWEIEEAMPSFKICPVCKQKFTPVGRQRECDSCKVDPRKGITPRPGKAPDADARRKLKEKKRQPPKK